MSSVVTDLLNSAGVLAKEDIASKVENLKVKIEDIKIEVQESLKNRYIDFIPQYVKFDKLVNSLNSVRSEYDVLVHQIEKEIRPQMTSAVVDYREMQDDLKRISCLKDTVLQLIDLHRYLENGKNALGQQAYMEAVENLLIFKGKCNEINIESQKDIQIIYALNLDYVDTYANLVFQLGKIWKENVSISQLEGNKHCRYHIDVMILQTKPAGELLNAIHAMERIGELKKVLKPFGEQFLNIVCTPIMTEQVEIKLVPGDKTVITLLVLKRNEAPNPKAVFQHLIEFFRMLHTYLFNWPIVENDENSSNTLMKKFGSLIGDEFCNMLVEKCIKPAVPTHSQGLESFQNAIDHVINLQNLLREFGFFCSQENPLMTFIKDIDELPANKMALDLLSRARDLMKQDLYQTKLVGIEKGASNETKPDPMEELNQMAKMKNGLSKASFAFPACQISVFAESLVELLHEVMQEAKNLRSQHETYSLKLFYTARNICDLYCCIVPTFHKDAIANMPQQTAIHHNNCMYIAHDLLTLGLRYDLQSSFPVTFVDLAYELKRIGAEAFLAQMRNQRQQLLHILQDDGAFQITDREDNLLSKAEKAVQKCLNHLQLLKHVWSDVLPIEVYFKSMGTLMNTFMEEIVLRITSMEDIVAQTSAHLDSVFGIVLMQSPDLFNIPRENRTDVICNYVHRWFKFQELQLVLSASLVEIVDRWSSGKGPLATHFSAEEVKHLIRALFQNTERRAAALGKIR